MAYAALRSLAQILHQTLNRDYQYLILDEKQQIKSLVEKITYLQKDLSSQKLSQDEEIDIRDAAYVAEDIIESRIIERFSTESAGHEDGSTEKKIIRFEKEYIRFDVIENWIVSLSNSASERSGLEIVGVDGIEKPRTFQTIYGIRQLARTHKFKAWFLGSEVLHETEAGETGMSTYVLPPGMSTYAILEGLRITVKKLATNGTKIVIISDPSSRAYREMWRAIEYDAPVIRIPEPLRRARDALPRAKSKGAKNCCFAELINGNIKKFKWAWWKKPSPASLSTWHDREAKVPESPVRVRSQSSSSKYQRMYKSAMVMAGVDSTDQCIVVGRHYRDIEAANAAGISSIFIPGYSDATMYGHNEFTDINDVRSALENDARVNKLEPRHDVHPTYVLPLFTW